MVPKGFVYAMQISDIKYYLYDYMKTPDGNYISHDIHNNKILENSETNILFYLLSLSVVFICD